MKSGMRLGELHDLAGLISDALFQPSLPEMEFRLENC